MVTRRRMCKYTGPDLDGWCHLPADTYCMVVLNLEIDYCEEHAHDQLMKGFIVKVED